MSISGVNYKVSTVGKGQSTDVVDEQQQNQNQQIDDYFEDAFSNPAGGSSTGSSQAASGDPLDSYTTGDVEGGAVTDDPYAGGSSWMHDFPPTLEQVVAGNETAMQYLDLVSARYEQAKSDLHELIASYEAALPTATASQKELLLQRIELATRAIGRCDEELAKVDEKMGQQAEIYVSEKRQMKDLNNDGWIGRPFFEDSFYCQYNDDGTITYLDPVTRRAVPCPIMDPDYSAQLTSNDNLQRIDASQAMDDPEGNVYDMYLQLTEAALTNVGESNFNCPIDIGIPEYLWVERDETRQNGLGWATDFDNGQDKARIYDEWETSGGIRQKVPADLAGYVQVQITGVDVKSVPSGLTVDGDPDQPLYHHVIEFKNGDNVIARIRIEGFETSNFPPVAVDTDAGSTYVAASSVGIALNGDLRASPVELNASGLMSTGRHVVDGLENQLGIRRPNSGSARRSYDENIDAFSERVQETEYYDVDVEGTAEEDNISADGDWQSRTHDFTEGDYGYAGSNDRFIPRGMSPGENDSLATYRTGIFIRGVRGDITGSRYNDVIQTNGVDEFSDYAEGHLPEERQQIVQGDPYYNNRVNSMGGNDVVVAGKGNNYILNATFVDIQDSNTGDENMIALPEIQLHDADIGNPTRKRNPKCFVDVAGGGSTVHIYNPSESYSRGDSEEEEEAWLGADNDDYIHVGAANAVYFNPDDNDIHDDGGDPTGDSINVTFDSIVEAAATPMDEWYDELTKTPEVNEEDIGATWDEVMAAKSSLDDEMNGFFEEMFGGIDSLFGDMDL